MRSFSNLDLPQCNGKIALITGGTRGIGLEVIKMLLQCDIHVIIGTVNLLYCKIPFNTIYNEGQCLSIGFKVE